MAPSLGTAAGGRGKRSAGPQRRQQQQQQQRPQAQSQQPQRSRGAGSQSALPRVVLEVDPDAPKYQHLCIKTDVLLEAPPRGGAGRPAAVPAALADAYGEALCDLMEAASATTGAWPVLARNDVLDVEEGGPLQRRLIGDAPLPVHHVPGVLSAMRKGNDLVLPGWDRAVAVTLDGHSLQRVVVAGLPSDRHAGKAFGAVQAARDAHSCTGPLPSTGA